MALLEQRGGSAGATRRLLLDPERVLLGPGTSFSTARTDTQGPSQPTPQHMVKKFQWAAERLDLGCFFNFGGLFGAIMIDSGPSRPRHPSWGRFLVPDSVRESSGACLGAHFRPISREVLTILIFSILHLRTSGFRVLISYS